MDGKTLTRTSARDKIVNVNKENTMLQVGDSVKINSGYYEGRYGAITQIHEPYNKPKIPGTENNTHVVEVEPRKFTIRFNPQRLEKTEEVVQHDYNEIENEREEIFKVGNLVTYLDDDNEPFIWAEVKEVVEVKPHLYEYALSIYKMNGDPPSPYTYPLPMKESSSSSNLKEKVVVIGKAA
jgi:hypothetical protein